MLPLMKLGLPKHRDSWTAEATVADFYAAFASLSCYNLGVLSFDFVLHKRKSEMLFFSTELSIAHARNTRGVGGYWVAAFRRCLRASRVRVIFGGFYE